MTAYTIQPTHLLPGMPEPILPTSVEFLDEMAPLP